MNEDVYTLFCRYCFSANDVCYDSTGLSSVL